MAGYITEPHEYEGKYVAGEELANGLFVYLYTSGGKTTVKKLAAASDANFRVYEKTTLFGLPAVRLACFKEGDADVFFTEDEFEDYGDKEFNTATYAIPAGHFVKMAQVTRGKRLIMSVSAELYATLAVGDTVKPATGGTIAKVV